MTTSSRFFRFSYRQIISETCTDKLSWRNSYLIRTRSWNILSLKLKPTHYIWYNWLHSVHLYDRNSTFFHKLLSVGLSVMFRMKYIEAQFRIKLDGQKNGLLLYIGHKNISFTRNNPVESSTEFKVLYIKFIKLFFFSICHVNFLVKIILIAWVCLISSSWLFAMGRLMVLGYSVQPCKYIFSLFIYTSTL